MLMDLNDEKVLEYFRLSGSILRDTRKEIKNYVQKYLKHLLGQDI